MRTLAPACTQEEDVFRTGYETRVPSVDRAFDLLELLAVSHQGLTLAEISRSLAVPISSAHYIVQSLERRGYLSRDPSNREYFLGLSVAAMPHPTHAESRLKAFCRPFLQKLGSDLGLCAQLGVLKGSEALILDCVNTSLAQTRVGRHTGLHCSALGKALIVNLSSTELLKIFQSSNFPGHNEKTLCTLPALESNLKKARTNGYTVDNEENQLGSVSIGAPIHGQSNTLPIAAISVCSSKDKLPDWRLGTIGKEIGEVAKEVARDLREFPAVSIEDRDPTLSHSAKKTVHYAARC